jgi:prepilin-type N-terminal cleavage/methylation domain-containing protein
MTVRTQRGFTLIELMIALVISSLLVGMILAIFSRMSIAYRGQQQIAGVQQVLAAARATIETDAKQAGFGMPQGFRFALDGGSGQPTQRWPVRIYDAADGFAPDKIAFFYGDANTQGVVTGGSILAGLTITVDPGTTFALNDLVVVTTPDFTSPNPLSASTRANVTKFEACVLQVTTFTPGTPATLRFSTASPYGRAAQDHCVSPATAPAAGTMVYKFAARAYRIEPQNAVPPRPGDGVLQLSQFGGLFGDARDQWGDIAFGFTDIQVATRIYDAGNAPGGADFDGDGDSNREWLSGSAQTTVSGRTLFGMDPSTTALQMDITLVARTDRDIEGVGTGATPQLIDPANPDTGQVGNHDTVDLTTTTDPALVPTSLNPRGSRILRYISFQIDFRNLGVGLSKVLGGP